jgi:hypothetical protein
VEVAVALLVVAKGTVGFVGGLLLVADGGGVLEVVAEESETELEAGEGDSLE